MWYYPSAQGSPCPGEAGVWGGPHLGSGGRQGGAGFYCLQHVLLCCGVGQVVWAPWHQPRNMCVGEGGVAAVLVGMVEVGKEWLERGSPCALRCSASGGDAESLTRQALKIPGGFTSPQVLHPLPLSWRQQSGGTSNRDLGQEHPSPSPAPAEMAARGVQEEGASWDERRGQQLGQRWLGRRHREWTGAQQQVAAPAG